MQTQNTHEHASLTVYVGSVSATLEGKPNDVLEVTKAILGLKLGKCCAFGANFRPKVDNGKVELHSPIQETTEEPVETFTPRKNRLLQDHELRVLSSLVRFLRKKEKFSGNLDQLLKELTKEAKTVGHLPRWFPTTSWGLSKILRRIEGYIKEAGIKFEKSYPKGRAFVTLEKIYGRN